jgi:hypothetical protein
MRDDGTDAMLMSNTEFDEFLKREAAGLQKMVSDLGISKQ